MRISVIKQTDVANGVGIRVSIFVSGCRHSCKDCFNKEIWSFDVGNELTDETLKQILSYVEKPYIKGITMLGGEPLETKNLAGTLKILKIVKENFPNKDIWCYTGFTYEYLTEVMMPYFKEIEEIFKLVDVLVDGRFEADLLDLKLRFRGSKNQRVIDLQKTIKNKEIVWYLDYEDGESKYVNDGRDTIYKVMDKLIRKEIEEKKQKL